MKRAILKSGLLLASMTLLMCLAATATAAVPGITGPTFNLTAQPAYLNQPDGSAVYSWGYGCNGTPAGTAPSALGAVPCPTMQVPGPTLIVNEGQTVTVAAHGLADRAVGKIVFISPMLDREAHSARVVAEIANSDGNWRPGSLVHATIEVGEYAAPLAVPSSAVQTIGKGQVVFVRTADGFEKRMVGLGHSDDRISEIVSGVAAGETIAVTNTFALKAELLKSLAED